MAAHRVVTAGAKVLFHAAAWGARAGSGENCIADTEFQISQRLKVNATDDDVATEQNRVNFVRLKDGGDDWQVLGLNECYLSFAARLSRKMVANDAGFFVDSDGLYYLNRRQTRGTNT